MIKDCPKCRRKKVIMGMGAILKTCPECNGIGHIKVEDEPVKVELPDEIVNKEVDALCSEQCVEKLVRNIENEAHKKSRGRPRKVSDEREEA